ncbi:hypothetical protein [Enterococcus hirae]|uniref:hypothetical protein n=1 Tax=Enterococcus hirae TaxID=1354 RepID=UPI00136B0DBF|nr:hypothetical protein [Enterococcus hirae]NAE18008.1 hypothetical protein [Enterococcus hirae]
MTTARDIVTAALDPVSRLRAAEQRLRDVAGAATPGPWVSSPDGVYWIAEGPIVDIASDVVEEDARYIAALAPPVALALADWLAHEIRDALWYEQEGYGPADDAVGTHSLAVADAVLGSES